MSEPQSGIENTARIDRKEAEFLVRGWNLLFNRCFSYAFDHPLVQETIPRVWELFQTAIGRCGGLNIQLLEAMFFVDGADVMYQPNNRRIADHLRRFKVESLSLASGFSSRDFSVLIDASSLTHPDANSFLRYFVSHGGQCLEVNQVSLRALRGDQVASSPSASASGGGGSGMFSALNASSGGEERFEDIVLRAMVGRLTAQELEGNVALVQMLADPQALGRAAVDGTKGMAPSSRPEGVGQMVMNVLSHFATSQAKQGFTVEELLAGIYAMRSEMMGLVKSQQALEQGLVEEDVEAATDTAFDQTVCKIILDEYRQSKGNARRVAHVLGRVVPGKKELRRILPKLKDAFIASGSTIPEWYGLVKELSTALQGEKALEDLVLAASEMGVGSDEVVAELRKDPRSAAKLLVVAAEIRRAGGDPGSDASIQALLEAVDRTGDLLVEGAQAGSDQAMEAVRSYGKLQSEIRQELSTKDMAPELRANIMRKLDLRSQRTLQDLKARVLAQQLQDGASSLDAKVATMGELVRDEGEIDGLLELAMQMVGGDDLARQVAAQISERVRYRIAEERERAASRELPHGVYPKAVTEFFLRYESRRATRYGVPFSALLISFQGLPEDREAVEAHGQALRGLFNILAGDLRTVLRDVDFVGSLGFNRLLVVLPMTVEDGLDMVLRKIRERLARELALPDGSRAWVRPRLGWASFDHAEQDGLKEIMSKLSQKWQEDI
ncbi:MAG TPA: hypothetical protein PKO15_02985 [Fibrobacteria bacterium]|nr:hypothetical protein [Fibrobacteria bacterium]